MGGTGLPHDRDRSSKTIGGKINPRHLLLGATLLASACDLRPGTESLSPATPEPTPLTYSAAQADRGRQLYLDHCVLCHGINLSDAQFGAPLKGAYFQSRWHGRTAADLFLYTQATMPPEKPMSLSEQNYADVLTYVLQENNVAAGGKDLPAAAKILLEMPLPW